MAATATPSVLTINDYSPEEQIELTFSNKIRGYSICAFFLVILFNFIFYVVFFSTSNIAFIFPMNDILHSYYDNTDPIVITIFIIDCIILLSCVIIEAKLTEYHISSKSFAHWIFFYILLNFFYIFLTPILILTIVKVMSISNCYPFKTKINKFITNKIPSASQLDMDHQYDIERNQENDSDHDQISNISSNLTQSGEQKEDHNHDQELDHLQMFINIHSNNGINDNQDRSKKNKRSSKEKHDIDTYFRLIAAHHWLSRLCHRLVHQSLITKHKIPNNKVLLQKLNEGLNQKLKEVMDRSNNKESDLSDLSYNNSDYSPKDILKECIMKKGKSWSFKRKFFLRLYLIAINVSFFRLMFFDNEKGFDFRERYFGLYVSLWIRIGLEFIISVILIIWMKTNEMAKKIGYNCIGTQYYYSILMSPEYDCIKKIIWDNLDDECYRFYQCWRYQLYGIDTKILLGVHIGNDIASVICEYLYENDIDCLNEYGELDVDEELWSSIKDTAFPDPQ